MPMPDDTRKARDSGETRSSGLPEANSEDDIFRSDTGYLNAEPTNQTFYMPPNRLEKDTHGSGSHEVRSISSSVSVGGSWVLVRRGPHLTCYIVSLSRLFYVFRFGSRWRGLTSVHLLCRGCRFSSQRIPTCQRRSGGVLRSSRWWRFRYAFLGTVVDCPRPESQTWQRSSGRMAGRVWRAMGRVGSHATRDTAPGSRGMGGRRLPRTNRRHSRHPSLCVQLRWS